VTDTIDANLANISTIVAEQITASTVSVSTLNFENSDVSGMYVSSIRGNEAFFSSITIASDLSGGVGYVRFHVDASGVQVDGDPIRFDNLVYLTSTINIVQVSTLVDTDIFSQNGFFSTFSSGSISTGLLNARQTFLSSIVCNDISGNNGSFDTLFVSSLEALDISGVAASNWSQYPTLNSSVIFQAPYVLSNVGNELFFAGTRLTDISGGGQNWSIFPAFSTVQMANNSLTGVSTVFFQDGGRLTSLTGNNLQYNGQPIQYGAASNVSQWAQYPASANVNMSGNNLSNAALVTGSNLNLTGSNVTNGNTFTGSLSVGGTTLIPLASISGGDLTCRNIEVGDSITGLADVNIYGATALPGDNALYVQGGVTCDGGTIHGFSAGVLPVAGINTGRIDMLQAGFNLLHPLVGAITTGTALSVTTGGALSLAAGAYVEVNTSTIQMINTSQGNKNTTIQAGFLTVDPDVAPTSSIKLFNTLGGGVEIDGGGQGSLQGFSTVIGNNLSTVNLNVSTINGVPLSSIQTPENIVCSNITVAQSTTTSTLLCGFGQISTSFWNLGVGVSTISATFLGQNYGVTNSIFASTNIGQIDAQIIGFSTIQGGQLSCIGLQVSTINGLPWDVSGGNASVSSFQTLETSTLKVSTMSGTTGTTLVGSTIFLEGGLQFVGGATGLGGGGSRFLSSVRSINNDGENLSITASTINLLFPNPNNFVRIGGGGAFDTHIFNFAGAGAVSTGHLFTSSIVGNPVAGLDISGNVEITGGLFVNETLELPLATGGINFDDGSGLNYTRLMRRDIANNNMLSVVNTPALGSNNMVPLGVGELWVTGGADQYEAVRLYSAFPYGNFGLDSIDANGTTNWEFMYGEETPSDGYVLNFFGVSSMTGTAGTYPGADPRLITNFSQVMKGPIISTLDVQLSSINGVNFYDISGINVPNDKFSTVSVSSLTVSSINGTNVTFNGEIPIGGIIMWSGVGVPANFALCNGANGTPNLSGQFILAEGGGFTRGQQGGSFTINLSQVPSHTHTITDPGHAHDVVLTGLYNNGESGNETTYAGEALGGPETRNLDPGAALSTFTGINITNTAGQGLPYYQPYFVLAYIMRIS